MRKSGEMENVRLNEKNKSNKKKSGKQLFEIPANEQFVADYLDELSFYRSGHLLSRFFKNDTRTKCIAQNFEFYHECAYFYSSRY